VIRFDGAGVKIFAVADSAINPLDSGVTEPSS
jgi:hypothetical protein